MMRSLNQRPASIILTFRSWMTDFLYFSYFFHSIICLKLLGSAIFQATGNRG